MSKLTALVCCVLLLAGAASAFPGASSRRAAQDSHPDRDVEVVEPVTGGGSRGGARGGLGPVDSSDESPEVIPFGIGLRGLGGLGGLGVLGGGPIIIRPLGSRSGLGPRDSDEASDVSDEDLPGGYFPTGFLPSSFMDPMSNFMAQMAEMMAAMRRQMTQVLNRSNAGTDFSKQGNTTSTTKVIDGHVITVNDTVIGGEDGEDGIVHIRVIDVHPSESPESAEGDAAPTPNASADDADKDDKTPASSNDDAKDVESLGNSDERVPRPNRAENEIPMKVGSEVDDLNA